MAIAIDSSSHPALVDRLPYAPGTRALARTRRYTVHVAHNRGRRTVSMQSLRPETLASFLRSLQMNTSMIFSTGSFLPP
jgi:hypothetical protein